MIEWFMLVYIFMLTYVFVLIYVTLYYICRLMDSLAQVDLQGQFQLHTLNLPNCFLREYSMEATVSVFQCSNIKDQVGHSMPKDYGIIDLASLCLFLL